MVLLKNSKHQKATAAPSNTPIIPSYMQIHPLLPPHHIQTPPYLTSLTPYTVWNPAPAMPFSTAVSGSVQLTGLWIRSAQRK